MTSQYLYLMKKVRYKDLWSEWRTKRKYSGTEHGERLEVITSKLRLLRQVASCQKNDGTTLTLSTPVYLRFYCSLSEIRVRGNGDCYRVQVISLL